MVDNVATSFILTVLQQKTQVWFSNRRAKWRRQQRLKLLQSSSSFLLRYPPLPSAAGHAQTPRHDSFRLLHSPPGPTCSQPGIVTSSQHAAPLLVPQQTPVHLPLSLSQPVFFPNLASPRGVPQAVSSARPESPSPAHAGSGQPEVRQSIGSERSAFTSIERLVGNCESSKHKNNNINSSSRNSSNVEHSHDNEGENSRCSDDSLDIDGDK